ncbi:MAG: hypothetical protein WCW77_01940 [Patescibacteria group bacterium]|jgi:hypothetical protein
MPRRAKRIELDGEDGPFSSVGSNTATVGDIIGIGPKNGDLLDEQIAIIANGPEKLKKGPGKEEIS